MNLAVVRCSIAHILVQMPYGIDDADSGETATIGAILSMAAYRLAIPAISQICSKAISSETVSVVGHFALPRKQARKPNEDSSESNTSASNAKMKTAPQVMKAAAKGAVLGGGAGYGVGYTLSYIAATALTNPIAAAALLGSVIWGATAWVLDALGFTSNGIAAGSTAAAWMASAAAANGGGVAAGGVLQLCRALVL
ncbi:unnamed protein product [Phytophthora fragariaefolia]|uniref:Unnamed protein product n=1 Tax=Phytophthora fragariaefolia TaxID=1490495 RepID=A0A9W6Y6B4_9STRA|nr:unnamed protein product [Phytophthora fragariaefolia]